jgi:hypothetical protein
LKLNEEIIRKILVALEEKSYGNLIKINQKALGFEDVPKDVFLFHCRYMESVGLITMDIEYVTDELVDLHITFTGLTYLRMTKLNTRN